MTVQETVTVKYDRRVSNWTQDHVFNLLYLRTTENWANDILKTRGHLFLNDIYDMMGMPRTSQGAISGWLRSNSDVIKFWNPDLEYDEKGAIMLVFVTDGVIYDKIEGEYE